MSPATRGKVPRGLLVEDIRLPLEIEAETRLRHSAYAALRQLTCQVHGQVLTIRGRVPSYYLKQVAQSLLDQLEGIGRINNELDVASS